MGPHGGASVFEQVDELHHLLGAQQRRMRYQSLGFVPTALSTPVRVSIVINTYNRADQLRQALHSLDYLDYRDFEVVVVNGPSTDDTDAVLAEYAGRIKVGTCPETNLSMSRNIGIALASGDVVAFIDDDAVVERHWLERIVARYEAPDVAGVGGSVWDHTGCKFQFRYVACDRFGGAHIEAQNFGDKYCIPFGFFYTGLIGTNCSFRRDALVSIGGFDEEFEYHLDETDICLRLNDLGHRVIYADDAFVHHKYAPSQYRDDRQHVKNWYPILKNRVYFALRNNWDVMPRDRLRKWYDEFSGTKVDEYTSAIRMPRNIRIKYEAVKHRALADGFERGWGDDKTRRLFLAKRTAEVTPAPFLRFRQRWNGIERRTLCFVMPGDLIPPQAREQADSGHDVHVVGPGGTLPTVEYHEGIWVHRVNGANGAVSQEVARIRKYRHVDELRKSPE